MEKRVFMEGNEAMAEAAIRAGCKLFFGYPITPATEVLEYYARAMAERPEEEIMVVQAETELAAFSMVAGAAASGNRAMTATSGPGFSLGQESMSFMSAAEIPAVVVDSMRPGPGDGEILPAQGDYFQAVKGGGHGDYNTLVLAPYSIQEMCDLIQEAFVLAEKYCNPVVMLVDSTLSKMREAVALPGYTEVPDPDSKPNALRGCGKEESHHIITSGDGAVQWGEYNDMLQEKFKKMRENEVRYESYEVEDADIVMVAYGSMARVCQSAMRMAREKGIKAGMIRPISLWPFPKEAIAAVGDKKILVCELSAGQMVEDVQLSVKDRDNVYFHGKLGGATPTADDILSKIEEVIGA